MKFQILVLAAAFAALGAASGRAQTSQAPDFSLATVPQGKNFRLSDHKGKVVLVDFWATWCPPCRKVIPHLAELHKKYRKKGLVVVGVSVDHAGEELLRTFVHEWKMTYPVVWDSDRNAAKAYGGVPSLPTTFLVGRDGRLIGKPMVGAHPLEFYESAVKEALKKK
jgi:thiol-disulfide isomerase/thioredoxin